MSITINLSGQLRRMTRVRLPVLLVCPTRGSGLWRDPLNDAPRKIVNRSYLRCSFQHVAPIESQRWVGSGRKLQTSSSAVPGPACHIPPLKLVRSNLNSSKLTLFHIIFAYFKPVGLPKASRSGPARSRALTNQPTNPGVWAQAPLRPPLGHPERRAPF